MMFSVGTSARSAARRRGCAESIKGAARAPGRSAASQDPRQECRAKQAKKSDAACREERTELSLAARDDGCNLYSPVVSEVLDVLRNNPRKSTSDDACKLAIHDAENDAFPDWAYR